ncbi:MAG: choline-phosphate cytidylyltransferase, partial [Bacillota bacterium]|nr:choline-phosphate cytidylyltransferase [Bacillota bacterium]
EILIERQISQLKAAGIEQIIVVAGYKKEQFYYLEDKFDVIVVDNDDYNLRNNNSSIYAVRDYLNNSYICSADNYFTRNPFEKEVDDSYYAALYANGETDEWCIKEDEDGYINHVQIGGRDSWYMLGHVFWNESFSKKFVDILIREYDLPQTKDLLWEAIYMNHLDELKLKIRRYDSDFIFEFDTLEELRLFDSSYLDNSGSKILEKISKELQCNESQITNIVALKAINRQEAIGFSFICNERKYQYDYNAKELRKLNE